MIIAVVVLGTTMAGCAAAPNASSIFEQVSGRLLLPSERLMPAATPVAGWNCAAPRPEREMSARFADGIQLVGYRLDNPAPAGDTLVVTLYWAAMATPGKDYKVFVHLLGGNGSVATQQDGPPVGGTRPTSKWLAGSVVQDAHFIPLPASHPLGSYSIEVGLYREDTGVRLRLLDDLPVSSPDAPLLPERLQVVPVQPMPKATSH